MTITPTVLAGFALAMFVMAVTPGPAVFSLTARSIASGPKAGLGVVAGVVAADLFYFTLALVGMSTLSGSLGEGFIAIKLFCAAYLAWLGIKMWRAPVTVAVDDEEFKSRQFYKNFIEGLAVNLGNPKTIIFFAALLPSFVELSAITALDSLALMAIIVIVAGGSDLVYVLIASRARNRMQSQRAQTWMNRVGGVTLVGVATGIAAR